MMAGVLVGLAQGGLELDDASQGTARVAAGGGATPRWKASAPLRVKQLGDLRSSWGEPVRLQDLERNRGACPLLCGRCIRWCRRQAGGIDRRFVDCRRNRRPSLRATWALARSAARVRRRWWPRRGRSWWLERKQTRPAGEPDSRDRKRASGERWRAGTGLAG